MKKKNFVSLVFGTVGGILFALGMCMCLLPEWGAFTPGVVIAAVGAAALLVLLLVRRKMAGKPAVHISGKAVGAVLLGIVGALVLGVGMCMAMVWGTLGYWLQFVSPLSWSNFMNLDWYQSGTTPSPVYAFSAWGISILGMSVAAVVGFDKRDIQ